MNPVSRTLGILGLTLAGFALSACTSAEKLMEDGAKLESEGRYAEAARKYIDAYDKDPTIAGLDEMATELGNRVVEDWLAEAARASSSGQPIACAEAYLSIDDLVLRAYDAGIYLDRPSDYAELRYGAFRDAVASLTEEAQDRYDHGDVARADALIRDALDQFDPTPEETETLLLTRYDVLLAWADRATNEGRFREAIARADEALAVAEQVRATPEPALALRARAIDLGTLYVAAAPVATLQRERDRNGVSPWFIAEINDRLELNYWSAPPELIAMAHSALVRQRIRQLGFGRHALSRRDARILASDLGADFVVVTDAERFDWTERDLTNHPKRTKTTSGRDVVYTEIRGKIEYEAQLRLRIVSRNGDLVFDDHIREHRQRNFKRGQYDGDYRDLDLSGSERRLFQSDRFDDLLAEVENELIDRVTERIADRVYERLGNEVR